MIHRREDLATKPILYLFTQDNCVNCPAAKAVVNEAFDGSDIVDIETIDLQKMDPDFEFKLLENQIFISSTPAIIVANSSKMKLLYSGNIPEVDTIRQEVKDFA